MQAQPSDDALASLPMRMLSPGSNGLIVVLDASVLVAGFLTTRGLSQQVLILLWQQKFIGVVSLTILEETERRLRDFTDQHVMVREYLHWLQEHCRIVRPKSIVQATAVRDVADQHVLAAALASKANLLVSYDKDLLVLKEYLSIGIIHPRSLLYLL